LQWDKLAIYTIPNCNYWYLTFFGLFLMNRIFQQH
jgi:hypothetical protein